MVANALRLLLVKAGYSVSGIASSAEEADENLQKYKPDLVILDIRLSGKQTGIDLARKLRAENIAFIYLSANSSQKILEEAKKTEPYGFLVKPYREKDLLVALDIAFYRQKNSLEAKLRQEELLRKRLAVIYDETPGAKQKLLEVARMLQPHIPFDLIVWDSGPVKDVLSNCSGYMRTGFDEYQYIDDKGLMTIVNSKTNPLESRLVFPLVLDNRLSVHYYFYSRQKNIYHQDHTDLLERIKKCLTGVTEKMVYDETPSTTSNGKRSTAEKHKELSNVIGNHPLLLAALDLTSQVAPYNTSVLILGESGTGKEMIAQSIHSLSTRKNGPFIKINCAAIPATLMESELFGHEKGAFTGATEKRRGRFEQADGGTIFLDEIGELSLDMQIKLLRVLQDKEVNPLGSHSPRKVDVRIVAATNRNLEKEVAANNFRLDLYYRLNVFPITLPPLRERQSDIEILALFFARKFCKEFNKEFSGISASMMEQMYAYDWPGNIRELENVMERSVILNNAQSELTLKQNLKGSESDSHSRVSIETLEDVKQLQRQTERDYILSILKKTDGRIRGANGAAELLNIKPTTLESKMAKLGIKKDDL